MTNLNELAYKVTLKEGKIKSLSIAQVKEVLRLVLRELKGMSLEDLATLLRRIK